MSWEDDLFALFDDLEGHAEALYDAERGPELADRSRAEYRRVSLASRLMASVEGDVTLDVLGVGPVAGRLERVADGWCLVSGAAQDWIVVLAAVGVVHGAADRSVPEMAWSPVARLGLGSALRRLADSGQRCVAHLRDGSTRDGALRRVGADFVELVTGGDRILLVGFDALAAVQSRG
ncbi:MAG TPA: hypothetical protein VNQ53_04785 [Nocardioides sp.]|nr:hypothetical protein [Nocardioides sp.]